MVLSSKTLREACQTILYAIDKQKGASFLYSDTLELVAEGNELKINVTNNEYYCSCRFVLPEEESFRVAVDAKTFVSLISKITTDNVTLTIESNSLVVKANGSYKLPIVYNNDKMVELPKISLGEVTNEMDIPLEVLQKIYLNNSKIINPEEVVDPIQNYYYVDELGALTFTSRICVTTFNLPNKVKMLLSDKVVKLFKLFKNSSNIHFKMGQSQIGNDRIQTIVQFKDANVDLVTRLTDSSLTTKFPVAKIRDLSETSYPYSMVFNKSDFMQLLNRLLIFSAAGETSGKIHAEGNSLTIEDFSGGSVETIYATQASNNITSYDFILDLKTLRSAFDGTDDQYLTMNFGNSRSVSFIKQGVTDIIPEAKIRK